MVTYTPARFIWHLETIWNARYVCNCASRMRLADRARAWLWVPPYSSEVCGFFCDQLIDYEGGSGLEG